MSTPPNIDSWQQSHTVCCVSPLVSMLIELWDVDSSSMDEMRGGIDAATRCDCLDENGGEPLEDCDECINGETGTVFEYWVIDTYLAGLLESIGEGLFDADVIGIVGDGKVWCRTTSGQLIAADWAIETAYKLHCEQCYGGEA